MGDALQSREGQAMLPEPLLRLADKLRCPDCATSLVAASAGLGCPGCAAEWPVRDGIARLARGGAAETWSGGSDGESDVAGETSVAYQARYRALDEAREYNEAYRDQPTKRMSTVREFRLLDRLLASQGHVTSLLDIPSGGGRLSSRLESHCDLLVEADIAEGQLEYARRERSQAGTTVYMTASAFHIPFHDGAVDGVVCCRLCHHLPTAAERERLVGELLRVAGRFAIMTFFDHDSLKNRIRRFRQPFNRKPPKLTMRVARVAELARIHGARLDAAPALSRLFSGHRYALMVKD